MLRRTIAGLTLVTLFAAGCTDDSSDGDQPSAGAGGELATSVPSPSGDVDTITWGLPYGEPTTVDPILGLDYSPTFVSSQMCEALLMRDEDGIIQPNLATYDQVDDLTLVLDVRDDVTFWDGTPMTVDDVIYTLERNAAPESYINSYYENVKSFEKTGPNQVTVHMKSPDAAFLGAMASYTTGVLQKAFTEEAGEDLGTPSGGIMCTGPFKFGEWVSGDKIVLERNDDYWNDEGRAHAGELVFKFFDDSSTVAQALLSGEIDGAYEVPFGVIERLQDADNGTLTFGASRQYVELYVREAGADDPMGDPAVRQALAGVLDRDGIAGAVFAGAAKPYYLVVEPDSWDPEARDLWAAQSEEREAELGMSVDEAAKLVEESSYDGAPISIQVLAGDTTQSKLAQVIQQSGESIGLNIEIMPMQPTEYSDAGLNRDLDAGDMALSISWNSAPQPLAALPWYVLPDSPYNFTYYDDPEAVRQFKEGKTTLDPQARNVLLTAVEKAYGETFLSIPVVEPDEVLFINDRLTGADPSVEYMFTPSMANVGASG